MTSVLACILAPDGVGGAERTINSLTRFGLPVAVGTREDAAGAGLPGVQIHRLEWQCNLADTRNQLAALVEADWLLWIDIDEELTVFDAARIAGVEGPLAAIWLRDRLGFTARPALRLQRQGGAARWTGTVHEILSANCDEALATIDDIRLESFAFENPERIEKRRARDSRLAAQAQAAGDGSFEVLLALARAEENAMRGSDAFMAWVRAYNHPGAAPTAPTAPGVADPQIEVAEQLCAYDYMTPALLLLKDNPTIASLRFQVLATILWSEDRLDEEHFDALATCLAEGQFDRRYSIPSELIGIGRRMLQGAIEAHVWTRFDSQSRNRARLGGSREGRYLVVPAEMRQMPTAPVLIKIDAGLSFGSGDHPSSYLCLRAIEWLAHIRQFRRILDIGAGSGVLSIAALKTWPARSTALEINAFVAAKGRQNIRANGVAPRVRTLCDIGSKADGLPRGTRCELALVNLNYAELTDYAPALRRSVAPGGVVVLSGLGSYHERYVANAFHAHGFVTRKIFRQDGWSAIVMQAGRAKALSKARQGRFFRRQNRRRQKS